MSSLFVNLCRWLAIFCVCIPASAWAESAPRPDINPCEESFPYTAFPANGAKDVPVTTRVVLRINAYFVKECLEPTQFKIDVVKDGSIEPLAGKMVVWKTSEQFYFFAFVPDAPLEAQTKYTYGTDNPYINADFTTGGGGAEPPQLLPEIKILSAQYEERNTGGVCTIEYKVEAAGAPDNAWVHVRAKTVPLSQDPYDYIIHSISGVTAAMGITKRFVQSDQIEGTACARAEICLRASYQAPDGAWGQDAFACIVPQFIPMRKEEPVETDPDTNPDEKASPDGGETPGTPDNPGTKPDGGIDVRVGCGCQSGVSSPFSSIWFGLVWLFLLLGRRKQREDG